MNCPLCEVITRKIAGDIYLCPVCDAEISPGETSIVVVSLISKGDVKAQYTGENVQQCFQQAYTAWEGNIDDHYGTLVVGYIPSIVKDWWESKDFRKIRVEAF